MKTALRIALLLFIAWCCYWVAGKVKASVMAHNQFMLNIATQDKEGARWQFLRDCVRKNPLKACEAAR